VTYGAQPPAFSPDSTLLATFVKGESLVIWTAGTWQETRRWKLPGNGRSLAFAPVGATLAVADDTGVALWNPQTGERVRTFTAPESGLPETVAWSPDAKYIASSGDDGVVRFWEASNSRLAATLYLFADMEDWILVAPDGSFDGTDRAVSRAIGWRQGHRVTRDERVSRERRKNGLWSELFGRPQ
jgi:WD40 repeat protein